MSPILGFPLFLIVTLGLLGLVVFTGRKARVRPHLVLVACALVSLGSTIYFAERLGHLYDLEAAGRIYPVHIFVAKVATVSYLLPIATGVMTLRNRRYRGLHFGVAMLVLALTALTAVTGTWMLLAAEPL